MSALPPRADMLRVDIKGDLLCANNGHSHGMPILMIGGIIAHAMRVMRGAA